MLKETNQESLQDLIKKFRTSSATKSTFLSKAINNIKKELNKDKSEKITALIKLLFLYINYYDIKWASFNSMEVISTCGIKGKLYGYLIASLQFKNNSDFIQLIPNQIRSDLCKQNLNNINSSLNCLNNIINLQLSNEMLKDLESQLNINNKLIRKKVIVSLTLSCEKFAISNKSFNYWDDYIIKIISLLDTKISNGVSICIISSIQRMCKISPKNCITVVVELMNYFTKTDINWNLIKIIDIFELLFQYEPKLTKKKEFIKVLSEVLVKTASKSVELQLVKLVLNNFSKEINPSSAELITTSEEKLKSLLSSSDSNLLLMALKIIQGIKKNEKYQHDVIKICSESKNDQIIFECVSILKSMITKENSRKIVDIVYKAGVKSFSIAAIIEICTHNNYEYISDSKDSYLWFAKMLMEIASQQIKKKESIQISLVLRDLCEKVESIREDLVEISEEFLKKKLAEKNQKIKEENNDWCIDFGEKNINESQTKEKGFSKIMPFNQRENDFVEVLLFIIGEYCKNDKAQVKLQNLETLIKENQDIIKETGTLIYFILCTIKLKLSGSKSTAAFSLRELCKNKEEIEFNNFLNLFEKQKDLDKILKTFKELPMNSNSQGNLKESTFPDELANPLPINEGELNIE